MADIQSDVNKTPGFWKNTGSVVAGSTAAALMTAPVLPATGLLSGEVLAKVGKNLTQDEVKILNKAGDSVLQSSGLAEKGVKFIRKIDLKFLRNAITGPFAKLKKLLNPMYQVALGRNAFFSIFDDTITHSNKGALFQFHELGHAMNKHAIGGASGKLGRFLQGIRPDLVSKFARFGFKVPIAGKALALAISAISFIALFKHKKAEGEKPKGFWDTVTTFIKNNVGKLAFLAWLPMALEEGLASLKGQQMAKKFLSPDLLRKVKFNNAIGFMSYLISAAVMAGTVSLAVKIKDKIAQPNVK